MSDVIYVDDNNFEAEVLSATLPVLVDFSAAWCGPCQKQTPLLEKFASENTNFVKVCKVDIDETPTMTAKLGIRSVPTLMLFRGGSSLGSKVGLTSFADMTTFVLTKVGA